MLHWNACEKEHGIKSGKKRWAHAPEKVVENEIKILRDFKIKTFQKLEPLQLWLRRNR